MHILEFGDVSTVDIVDLFKKTFSDSEGEEEGALIGKLVSELIETTNKADIAGFVASDGDQLIGAVFFSRLWLANEQPTFILSPLAVSTLYQGKGIGQKLICYGIEHLKANGVELLLTYGDPNYYGKTGFQAISEDLIKAPLELSFPHGWLAQSLSEKPIPMIKGSTRCVDALNQQVYW